MFFERGEYLKRFKFVLTVLAVIIMIVACFGVYNTNFKPQTDIVTSSLATTNEKVSYEPVTVRYVVDGDTLAVTDEDSNEFKVRLIGCNTPESVSSDENKNCKEGKEASEYTKSLVSSGSTVYLEYDNERYDKYGRVLAYVWLSEPSEQVNSEYMQKYMLNARLLANGQAETMFVGNNIKYKPEFLNIENDARYNSRGFWNDYKFDVH